MLDRSRAWTIFRMIERYLDPTGINRILNHPKVEGTAMADIDTELAMTNQSKGGILMTSESKLERKTKKPPSSKGEAGVGRRAELADHERGIGLPITYADDRHPMQSAPDHGPHK
jgi:hypothetical protein